MKTWSQIAIKISVLNVYCQGIAFKKAEYQYKSKRCIFKDSFEVVVSSLHDLLFGKVKIIFSTNDSRWVPNSELAGVIIDLKRFFGSSIDYGEYKLIAARDLYIADYFGRKTSLLGKICLGFEIRPLDENFEEKITVNIAGRIIQTIFSREVTDILININDILSVLLDGTPLCNLKNLVGIFLIDPLYNSRASSCSRTHAHLQGCSKQGCLRGYGMVTRECAYRAKRIVQYSGASFLDSVITNLMMRRQRDVKGVSDYKMKAILDRADVEEKNVLRYHEGDDEMVGFVLFLEESRIVISFRGTLTKNDIIHDLNTCYAPFLHGYAHLGIKKLAESFLQREWDNVEDQMKSRGIRKLLIAGYSLGGAVGAILHLTLRDRYGEAYNIDTVAFSSPPTVSRNIADGEVGNITTYNYGNDIVPKISLGALLDFKYMCISLMTDLNVFEDSVLLAEKRDRIKEYLERNDIHPKLYHPGSVMHVKEKKKNDHIIYGFKAVSSEFFADFSNPKSFPHDHMLDRFLDAFDYVLQHGNTAG